MLTVLFVMLAEVLIFVPSVANFRITWLTDRLTAAQLAALAAEAVPGGAVPRSAAHRAAAHRPGARRRLKRQNERRLVLPSDGAAEFDESFDFRAARARHGRLGASLSCACA